MSRRVLAAALPLAGCGAPRSYLGLDLSAKDPVAPLARAAQGGDKTAQLTLGRLFEEGRGVPEDLDRACRLYESAAATTGGTLYIYSPPVRPGAPAGRSRSPRRSAPACPPRASGSRRSPIARPRPSGPDRPACSGIADTRIAVVTHQCYAGVQRRDAMYSESDIDAAVAAGAITPEAAAALRGHVAAVRHTPAVDEEQFRLLTGFNDIFVSIACVLLLAAVGGIGGAIARVLAPAAIAAAAWGLAEYFTRQRRMALPSIILLLAFVGGVAGTLITALANDAVMTWLQSVSPDENVRTAVASVLAAGVAAVTAGAAWLHWRRFMVPITVAAGAVSVVAVAMSLIVGLIPGAKDAVLPLALVAGLAMFAFAMRWDMSDRERRTRRSDVAFWLHLAAAPMIAHALFNMLGVFQDQIGLVQAVIVLLLYVAFALVALAVDRRALLVSSLAYVLFALYTLFQQAGAVELSAAFTGLVIGSALLLLSAFWHKARRQVVAMLGGALAERLPPVAMAV